MTNTYILTLKVENSTRARFDLTNKYNLCSKFIVRWCMLVLENGMDPIICKKGLEDPLAL